MDVLELFSTRQVSVAPVLDLRHVQHSKWQGPRLKDLENKSLKPFRDEILTSPAPLNRIHP